MNELSTFTTRLKEVRKAAGLTQKQLAIQCGLSERGYQRIECGENGITLVNAIVLSDILDVSLDYLVGRSDDPTRH